MSVYVGSYFLSECLRAESQVFALLMLFLCDFAYYVFGQEPAVAMHLTLWYIVSVCHHDDVCENYIGSVHVGGYCGLSKSGLCVFGKLSPVVFLVVCECSSVLLQSIVMSYVDCGDDGLVVR